MQTPVIAQRQTNYCRFNEFLGKLKQMPHYIVIIDTTTARHYNNLNSGDIMQITSRFTIAVHTLLAIQTFQNKYKTTSDFIASSVNVNPVVIRRTLQNLKKAGIVDVKAGSGGATVIKDFKDVTLYDVYVASDCVSENLFSFHNNPNPDCPVGKNIHRALDAHLAAAQNALETQLKNTTLADVAKELNKTD